MRRLRQLLALLLLAMLPSSAFAAGTVVYQGGTGTQIWPYAATFSGLLTAQAGLTVSGGNLIAPTIIGGTGTTSTLTLQSTSGVGAAGADIIFKVGNNGATEAGRILNNGNVGIGTTAPGSKLHIVSTSNTVFQAETTGTDRVDLLLNKNSGTPQQWALSVAGSANGYGVPDKYFHITDTSSGLVRMVIDKSGNVGIGTTSPDRLLHPELADAVTAAVSYAQRLSHISSGTVADGFGVGLEFELEGATGGTNYVASAIESVWATAADATRKGRLNLYAYDTAARLGVTVGTDGAAALLGFYGVTAVARAAALTQTYSTADRTHAGLTSADLGAFTGGTVGFLDAAERDNIRTQFNALKADLVDLKQFVNSLVDDMQAYGLAQ